jgi:Spy/CpxP family protein refolding chaperone
VASGSREFSVYEIALAITLQELFVMIRYTLLGTSALALVLLVATPASAQFGRGFRIPPVVSDLMMMSSQPVQEELKLSAEQSAKIDAIAKQMRQDAMEIISGLQDLTPEEREEELPNVMEMVSDSAKELQSQVDDILDDEQTARMNELSLQRRGVDALDDKKVIEALKVTDDQKKELASIRDEAGAKQEEIIKEGLGGDRNEMRQKIQALQKETGDKALAVLTTEQRDAFDELKGAKFDFPRQRGFGF